MPTTFESVVTKYLRSGSPAQRTREEFATTIRKWSRWGGAVPLERLGRKEIREFLNWVHEDAASRQGSNPGRTANKVRSPLRAVLSWSWEHDLVDSLPRFPRLKPQRDVAGRYNLTKPEIDALYFATYQMRRPRGWRNPWPLGRYWRSALVVFFSYGVDTGTVWKTLPFHEPIRWRHVWWGRQSPDRDIKEPCPSGWLYYRRVKTGKAFWRPICELAGVAPKRCIESGEDLPCVLKDLRKTCATYYDEHVPESSTEILGHSAGGTTYRHYAHRAPLAFRAILGLPQPLSFTTLSRGFECLSLLSAKLRRKGILNQIKWP